MKKTRIEAGYLKVSNYALTHNRIPVCSGVELTNLTETPMEDVTVRCSGDFITDPESGGACNLETEGVGHDSCRIEVKEHDRFDLTRLSTNGKNLTKFDIWERKLLDFSLRNTLLNLSLRRRAVQFISFDVNRIEDHLQDGNEYRITSKPNVEIQFDQTTTLLRSKLHEELHELITNDI